MLPISTNKERDQFIIREKYQIIQIAKSTYTIRDFIYSVLLKILWPIINNA